MTGKGKQPEKPPVEIKAFTSEEIERAITKLGRRVGEVNALESNRVRFDDQRVYNAEYNLRDTILEIFGPNSPEYNAHQFHSICPTSTFGGKSEDLQQEEFEEGIRATAAMLEGLISRLEEKKADLQGDATQRIRSAFEGLDLHPRIASVAVELYRDGHYRNAVLDAAIALENLVKERSRRPDLGGNKLMTTVFSKNNPILTFNDLKDQTDLDEQEGMMHLYVGAALALRNPRAHSLLIDSPELALEYIAFLSLLAKRVDQARRLSP